MFNISFLGKSSGIRTTETEEKSLRQQIRKNYIETGEYSPQDEDLLLLKLAAGRFGKFSESFRLPQNCNEDRVTAKYDAGNLFIVIPKLTKPNPRPSFASPFFNDRDVWW